MDLKPRFSINLKISWAIICLILLFRKTQPIIIKICVNLKQNTQLFGIFLKNRMQTLKYRNLLINWPID